MRLLVVIAVLSCNLGCLLLSVWHQYSGECQVFLHLCFLVVLPGKPVCDEQIQSRFVYDSDTVLVYSEKNSLYSL